LPASLEPASLLLSQHPVPTRRSSDLVEIPGEVSNNKGINLPGVAVNVPALSDKDEEDLRWALRLGVDYIALSFVRDAKDITRVRSEEHTSELQSRFDLVCRLLLEKKK